MAKQSKPTQEIEKKPPIVTDIALPDYAGEVEGNKSEAAAQNRPRPRIKIVQGMSKPALKKEFGEGAVLLAPDNVLLAAPGDSFVGIPVFLWETFEKHGDINDKESPTVLESTSNRNSALARRCMAPTAEDREEAYGGNFTAKYHHVLNAFIYFDSGELGGTGGVLSWKIRGGGSRSGKNFAGLIARREDQKVWCYMNRIKFTSEQVEANEYAWWTVVASNPKEKPFIDKADVPAMKAMHDELKRLYAADAIRVVDENAGEQDTGGVTDGHDIPF